MNASGVKNETAISQVNPFALALFLASAGLISWLILEVDSRGVVNLLGWSKSPGYFILALLLALASFAFVRHESFLNIIVVSALFVIPVYLHLICNVVDRFGGGIFPLPTHLWLFLVFLPILLGCRYAHRMRLPFIVKVGYLMIGAYIGAVHLYNSFHPGQYMDFFGRGWTA